MISKSVFVNEEMGFSTMEHCPLLEYDTSANERGKAIFESSLKIEL
jgi:hypothetical protein